MKFFTRIIKRFAALVPRAKRQDHHTVCPVCNQGDEVIPMRYGKQNEEGMRLAQAGKIHLGGCMSSGRPSRYCKRDEIEF